MQVKIKRLGFWSDEFEKEESIKAAYGKAEAYLDDFLGGASLSAIQVQYIESPNISGDTSFKLTVIITYQIERK